MQLSKFCAEIFIVKREVTIARLQASAKKRRGVDFRKPRIWDKVFYPTVSKCAPVSVLTYTNTANQVSLLITLLTLDTMHKRY